MAAIIVDLAEIRAARADKTRPKALIPEPIPAL